MTKWVTCVNSCNNPLLALHGPHLNINFTIREGWQYQALPTVRNMRGLQYIGAGLQYIGAPKFYFQDSRKE